VTTCIALLRAVNVAGHNRVAMADLRTLLAGLGFGNPRSLLQSGNLVFYAGRRTGPSLEGMLEQAARVELGLETQFLVRTAGQWDDIVAGNPFPDEARRDPARLLVMPLKDEPGTQDVAALRRAVQGREQVQVTGREAYLVYPDGIGRSRMTAALIERHLGTTGTARNWNTVLKLKDLVAAAG